MPKQVPDLAAALERLRQANERGTPDGGAPSPRGSR